MRQWIKNGLKLIGQGWIGRLALINLLVAVTAFLKDVLLALYLGTSGEADAFSLAYFIPDTLGNNILASAIGVACVPVFSKLYAWRKEERLFLAIRNSTICFLFLSLAGMGLMYGNSQAFIYSFSSLSSVATKTILLYQIILPTMLLFPLISIGSSVLQIKQKFLLPALAPLLFNALVLVCVLSYLLLHEPRSEGVYAIAIFIVIGVAGMLIMIGGGFVKEYPAWAVWKWKEKEKDKKWQRKDLKDIYQTFLPYVYILSSMQVIYLVERYLASKFQVGTISALNYAFRLAQFPIWVFVSAIGAVVLPSMAECLAKGQQEELKAILLKSIKFILIITLPMTLFFYILRFPLVSVLFQRGAFDQHSVTATSDILAGYSLTICSQSLVVLFLRYFVARGKMIIPALVFSLASIANILADIGLIRWIGPAGIGYGAAIGNLLNLFILFILLNRQLGLYQQHHVKEIIKICSANAILFLLLLFSKLYVVRSFIVESMIGKIFVLGFTALVCIFIYLIFIYRVGLLDLIGRGPVGERGE